MEYLIGILIAFPFCVLIVFAVKKICNKIIDDAVNKVFKEDS